MNVVKGFLLDRGDHKPERVHAFLSLSKHSIDNLFAFLILLISWGFWFLRLWLKVKWSELDYHVSARAFKHPLYVNSHLR